jgi:hypothetical protein
VASPAATCPAGSNPGFWNPTGQIECLTTAQCSNGWTLMSPNVLFSGERNMCLRQGPPLQTQPPTCPSGTDGPYNGQCSQTPICPSGWNATTGNSPTGHVCVVAASFVPTCGYGLRVSPDGAFCLPTCPSGTSATPDGGFCLPPEPTSTDPAFTCQFNTGQLAGNTILPTGTSLSGPAGAPCTDNYGSTGIQVLPRFACQFNAGRLSGNTIVPTGVNLSGPAGAPCSDGYGSSGVQVSQQ